MQNIFAPYPEFLCIDATYKLTEVLFPVFLLLVEGQSEVAAVFLLPEETEESMTQVMAIFKKHNILN